MIVNNKFITSDQDKTGKHIEMNINQSNQVHGSAVTSAKSSNAVGVELREMDDSNLNLVEKMENDVGYRKFKSICGGELTRQICLTRRNYFFLQILKIKTKNCWRREQIS